MDRLLPYLRRRGRSRFRSTERSRVQDEDPRRDVATLTTTSANPFGLNLLTPDLDDEQLSHSPLDIVAIHGVYGHPYKSWLKKDITGKDVLWLKDFLPIDIPGARVFSFGYGAQVAFSNSKLSVEDFARSLLNSLKLRRGKSRPLVFICHSMGGIVVKQALIIDRLDAGDSPIRDTVKGILFLSTPHRGSSSIHQGPLLLADIARATLSLGLGYLGSARSDLLRTLEKDSKELLDISNYFRNQVRGIKIISCYELNTTPPFLSLIVDKNTGRLGFPDEVQIPMSGCDHHTVCKFSSKDDQNYKQIIYQIKTIIDTDKSTPFYSQDQKNCLQSLYFREIENRQDEVSRAADKTCVWLLEHEKFQKWLYENRGLLWIVGKPGAGKSTLLKHALRNISRLEPAAFPDRVILISFFFYGCGTQLQRTPLGLFRSILYQLLDNVPSFFPDLIRTFKKRQDTLGQAGEKWDWRLAELQDIIEASLPKILEKYSIRIFVDALDECQEEAAIEVVRKLQNLVLNALSSSSMFSICFTCRHYPILNLNYVSKIIVEEENDTDIAKYVRHELRDSESQLADAIIGRSQGIFQWVFLVVKQVLNLEREGKTTKQIEARIKQIPQDLHTLYQELLKGIRKEERSATLKLIQWVGFAIRPLSLDELRFAMAIDADTPHISLRHYQDMEEYTDNNEMMERNVIHLSCGLIEVQASGGKRIAQFIHQSVSDFFLQGGLQILDSSWESLDQAIGTTHYRLSRSCIRYIAMEEIGQVDIPSTSEFPFLRYATAAWLTHWKQADAENVPQADLLDYLDWLSNGPFQRWMRLYQVICTFSDYRPPNGTTLLHIMSKYGLTRFLSAILQPLDNADVEVNIKDELGRTPLFYAAGNGHQAIVEMLLQRGADINAKDIEGTIALHWAAIRGHGTVIPLLIKNADSIDIECKNRGTPLAWAIEHGSEAIINLLLEDPKVGL